VLRSVNTAPTISDILEQSIKQESNTGALTMTIGDAQSAPDSLSLSGRSSNNTLVPNANIVFSGSGANRTVTVTPASGQSGTATITLTVSDGLLNSSDTFILTVDPVAAMVLIPAGTFTMGDSLDGISDAPTRTVTLDAFYMGKYEVTWKEWYAVYFWGLSNGYTDLDSGSGKAINHPVYSVTWYDMVKWCNALSQKEGLTPVYYSNVDQTIIYKTGNVDLTNAHVKWSANGYRLPTEAEWEKAARGGLSRKRFPWGDTISHSQSNYFSSTDHNYDTSVTRGYHPTYATGSVPYTSPVGAFEANDYGLHDMAGNVSEWCWDRLGAYESGIQTNPLGATSGKYRVSRGGKWDDNAIYCSVGYRGYMYPDFSFIDDIGFRVARSLPPLE
jgi:formylglycine-generating enzyme required for sulfatase activity